MRVLSSALMVPRPKAWLPALHVFAYFPPRTVRASPTWLPAEGQHTRLRPARASAASRRGREIIRRSGTVPSRVTAVVVLRRVDRGASGLPRHWQTRVVLAISSAVYISSIVIPRPGPGPASDDTLLASPTERSPFVLSADAQGRSASCLSHRGSAASPRHLKSAASSS